MWQSFRSMPEVVRFSPNVPGLSGPVLVTHPVVVLDGVGVDRLVGSAVDAPVGLVVTGEVHSFQDDRAITDSFQMADVTERPCHSTVHDRPTLTETITGRSHPVSGAFTEDRQRRVTRASEDRHREANTATRGSCSITTHVLERALGVRRLQRLCGPRGSSLLQKVEQRGVDIRCLRRASTVTRCDHSGQPYRSGRV